MNKSVDQLLRGPVRNNRSLSNSKDTSRVNQFGANRTKKLQFSSKLISALKKIANPNLQEGF